MPAAAVLFPGAQTRGLPTPASRVIAALLMAAWCAAGATARGAGIANAAGAELFAAHCAVCHQSNGKGIPGMYPPLSDSAGEFARSKEGRAYLVHVLSFGLNGPITVRGARYNGFMQSWAQLGDDDIAALLNHVLTDFNPNLLPRDFAPFTAREVRQDRARAMTSSDVYRELQTLGTASVRADTGK